MRILFICKTKPNFEHNISPIVKNQGDSLINAGHYVDYYVVEKGIKGYVKLIRNLGAYIKDKQFDVIHSHYSVTSFFTSIAIPGKKIVVSLMGSDTERKGILLLIVRIFVKYFWHKVIVKTHVMKTRFSADNVIVLPNGVDFEKFHPIPQDIAREKIGFSPFKKNILYLANPLRPEKNVKLAREAVSLLNQSNVVLNEIYPVSNEMVPFYLNASDVLVLPSLYEGSVNIVKEAMACCIPIVATDVGDVRENIGNTIGCYLAANNVFDFSDRIEQAIHFGKRTLGRNNINHLRSDRIAERLISIYISTQTD